MLKLQLLVNLHYPSWWLIPCLSLSYPDLFSGREIQAHKQKHSLQWIYNIQSGNHSKGEPVYSQSFLNKEKQNCQLVYKLTETKAGILHCFQISLPQLWKYIKNGSGTGTTPFHLQNAYYWHGVFTFTPLFLGCQSLQAYKGLLIPQVFTIKASEAHLNTEGCQHWGYNAEVLLPFCALSFMRRSCANRGKATSNATDSAKE